MQQVRERSILDRCIRWLEDHRRRRRVRQFQRDVLNRGGRSGLWR